MNPFIKIRSDIDDAAKKQIRQILKRYKLSQDELVQATAAIILDSVDGNGAIVLSPSLIVQLRNTVTSNLSPLAAAEEDILSDLLAGAYVQSATNTASALGVVGMIADWNILRKEFVDRAINAPISGSTFSSRIWQNTNDLANRIYNDILDCIRNGTRPNEIWRKIKNDYGVSAYQAKRLVNTELAKVVNDAQLEVYRNSDVVKKVMWSATLESNTCDVCGDNDGKIFDLDDAPHLPEHPNCRCALVPVVEGYEPRYRSDNETHEVIDYITFDEWKKNK